MNDEGAPKGAPEAGRQARLDRQSTPTLDEAERIIWREASFPEPPIDTRTEYVVSWRRATDTDQRATRRRVAHSYEKACAIRDRVEQSERRHGGPCVVVRIDVRKVGPWAEVA